MCQTPSGSKANKLVKQANKTHLGGSRHHTEQDTKTNLKETKRYSSLEEVLQTKAK